MRFKELVNAIVENHPGTKQYNSIFTQVGGLHKNVPDEVVKPSRGLFQLANAADAEEAQGAPAPQVISTGGVRFREQDFYASFAKFLKVDLDEATEAEALGGAGLQGKWGTPDVIGAYKPQAADFVKFPLELITAEIKIDSQQPIVAFGQAVAYRIFSHRTYIAMPTSLSDLDKDRLEALCLLFGIGLVLFDLNIDQPNFIIRMRAQRFSADMFYVNQFAYSLRKHSPETFQKLFG